MYLVFGHLDLYAAAIDAHAAAGGMWSDGEVLESMGVFYPAAGYRGSPHFMATVERQGLLDLWDQRGAPDYCSKDSGEWVCG